MTEDENTGKMPWLRWAALAALAAVGMALVGIVYKYRVQPQEAGWDERGRPGWEVPLAIGTHIAQYRAPLRLAVERINRQVGCQLVVVSDDPTITIVEGTIEVGTVSKDWAAGAWATEDWTYGRIVIYHPLMVGTDMTVIWHEIGEIFNLAHDRAWVMAPITEEVIGGPLVVPRFSDADAKLLHREFCGKVAR